MSQASEGVRLFHEKFGFPTRDEPRMIEGDELAFRKLLIKEEYDELQEALDEGNLANVVKEAADLLYVLYGLQWHLGVDFDAAFEAVQESNMSKLWPVDCEHCGSTGIEPPPSLLLVCTACHGALEARYREDGKVLKPPTYQPPDLSEIV